jgi:hypothetical protein
VHFFGFKLTGPDFQIVLEVVKRYNGDFVNMKEDGGDVGYFMFPKPKPEIEEKNVVRAEPAGSEPPTPQPALAPQEASKSDKEKLFKAPKQPSPITQFIGNFCSVCEDSPKCDIPKEGGRFYRVMCLQILDLQQVQLLNSNLEKLRKITVSQPIQVSIPVPAATAVAPPIQKVERNTRSTEGHKEGDVIWIYAENQGGKRYEKALEKDNEHSNDYFAMRRSIVEAEQAGKKGIVLQRKWCWLSNQRDYIGRKPAKTFTKGGGRSH